MQPMSAAQKADALRYPSRAMARTLLALSERATPGPWDAFGSHVSSIALEPDPAAEKFSRDSQDSHAYYGGALVCESCDSADTLLIATMRNATPSLAAAYLATIDRLVVAQRDLQFARAELEEERELVRLIRSERYQRPRFAVVTAIPTGAIAGGA